MPDDADSPAGGPADVLRLLERAVSVAKHRRRVRLGLVLVAAMLLGALAVLVVTALAV